MKRLKIFSVLFVIVISTLTLLGVQAVNHLASESDDDTHDSTYQQNINLDINKNQSYDNGLLPLPEGEQIMEPMPVPEGPPPPAEPLPDEKHSP
ncbi:hypothetical protein [Alkalibacillus aidingensis]|uniref:hypothetical protein n=1 Tax=Alkalibacillus aidingensis TaxID=2747607 RepID=UPI001660A6D0|nr:hypothetical protein [Alkalibacillus aidingensis]